MLQETISVSGWMTKASGQSSTFIYGLSYSYSEFKGFYENKLLEFPDSLDSAFTEASTYRVDSTVKSTISHSITD